MQVDTSISTELNTTQGATNTIAISDDTDSSQSNSNSSEESSISDTSSENTMTITSESKDESTEQKDTNAPTTYQSSGRDATLTRESYNTKNTDDNTGISVST
jgi:hypothetical protein